MHLAFVGSPSSGKTTLAAEIFSSLKRTGRSCEFLPEFARFLIAKRKFEAQSHKITLSYEDQMEILQGHALWERQFRYSCNNRSILISDIWSSMALVYMELLRDNAEAQAPILSADQLPPTPDYVFWCRLPLSALNDKDPNRVHDYKAITDVDELLPDVLQCYYPQLNLIEVTGNPTERARTVMSIISEKI